MKRSIVLLAVLLHFAAVTAQAAQPVKAPAFSGKDLQGNIVSSAYFLGKKPVLLMFWATW